MTRTRLLLSALGISSFLFLIQCTKTQGKPKVETISACDSITYNTHIKKLVDDNCISCHSPSNTQGATLLTTYAEVKMKAEAGRIKARAIDGTGDFMPQGGELTATQKSLLQCWLSNGMKEQ